MIKAQKDFLKAVAKNEPLTIHYFPRAMGKTYVLKYLKQLGKLATPNTDKGKDGSDE